MKNLLQFEAYFHLKQRTFYLLSLVFIFFGFLISFKGSVPEGLQINSSFHISNYTALTSLGVVFAFMLFAISAAIRDKQFHMEGLIYSSAIRKNQYFISRFAGVFIFSLVSYSCFLFGFAIGTILCDPERIAPFSFSPYIWSWLTLLLPNAFIFSSLLFSVSILSKSSLATYFTAILIYAFYMISSIFLGSPLIASQSVVPTSPEGMALAAIIDPFGMSAFLEQTQFWTIFQKNHISISFTGYFMWNRILWIAISLLVLIFSYHFFSFKISSTKQKFKKGKSNKNFPSTKYHPVRTSLNFKAQINSFWFLLKMQIKRSFISLTFLAILLVWLVIVIAESYFQINQGGQYNESWYPTTNLLIELFIKPLPIIGILIIVFLSAEIVWQERTYKFEELFDATPIKNWMIFLSKLASLVLIPVCLISLAIIFSLCFQIANDYHHFEFWLYFSVFYYNGINLFIYCIIALFIQYSVNNKYVGMALAAIIIFVIHFGLFSKIGIEHPLLSFGYLPSIHFSNMYAYSKTSYAYHLYTIYWLSFSAIIAFINAKTMRRGSLSSISFRMKHFYLTKTKSHINILLFFVLVLVSVGLRIFYHTNIQTTYISNTENLEQRADYEKKYKQFEELDRLYPIGLKTKMDIFPNENRYQVKVSQTLLNKSSHYIEQIFITEKDPLASIYLEHATLIEHDSILGTYLYSFNPAIAPQQKLIYTYHLNKKSNAFDFDRRMVKNGTNIMQSSFEPSLSYRKNIELRNTLEREKRGLPKREEEITIEDHLLTSVPGMGKVSFETIISTHSNQIAIGTGELIEKWKENDRNYFHYKSPDLINPLLSYISADYTVLEENYKGVNIEQYYDAKHEFNIDRISKFTKVTLDYCLENFGPYPYKHLRIVEIPNHWNYGGFAQAGTIAMVENKLYLYDLSIKDGFDLVAKRTIHEVAHQWWGHMLNPKYQEGGSLLVEGFAKYSEAVIMEKIFNKSAIWQLSQTANKAYFSGRSNSNKKEPPLILVNGQGYLSYGKNYTVMLALKELIGEEKINKVLKTLLDRHRNEVELKATSLEFLSELYLETEPEYHSLIEDWFKKVITYDLSIEKSEYKKTKDGKIEISLTLNCKRYEDQKNGSIKQISLNEPISIAAFSTHPSLMKDDSDILYLKQHQINDDQMEIIIIIDEVPAYVAIDPFGTRNDLDYNDNLDSI